MIDRDSHSYLHDLKSDAGPVGVSVALFSTVYGTRSKLDVRVTG